jgi:hypothetical protein
MERLQRMLSRGAETSDPDEYVELAVVPIAGGPMTVAMLQEHGIHARGNETFNVATNLLSDYRISVPRGELQQSSELFSTLG